MSGPEFLFWFYGAILVFSGLMVITVRNPVRAALFLVLAFFTSAAIWILAEAEFLALALVLVYVGAVMVLFLFVVMMLDINLVPLREGFARYLPLGAAIALVMVIEMALIVGPRYFGLEQFAPPPPAGPDYSNTRELGSVLYTEYVYPFEIAGVILLVAIIAAIALTLRHRPGIKHQDPGRQVRVRREERVRIVKLAAEKPQSGGEGS